MHRTKCVICKTYPLKFFYELKEFPLLTLPTNDIKDSDIFFDLSYGMCPECLSVQLIDLIDPSTLYNYPNKASLTPLWKEHHIEFAEFIQELQPNLTKLYELGGANNPLIEYFKGIEQYKVLDLHEPSIKDKKIDYILGNIETYSEYTEDTILLSHTFEHLYDPHSFLKHVQKSKVQNVFISVPNMYDMLKNKTNVSIIFNEHTFYFEVEDIQYMFAQYGFTCMSFKHFKNHSLFFYFKRDASTKELQVHRKENQKELFINHFFKREEKIKAIEINTPFYIMPSHYIGQMVYYYYNKKENIIGFLDNDKNKCNRRLYGTNCNTYSPTQELVKGKLVLLVNNPYKKEMEEQLRFMGACIVEFDL